MKPGGCTGSDLLKACEGLDPDVDGDEPTGTLHCGAGVGPLLGGEPGARNHMTHGFGPAVFLRKILVQVDVPKESLGDIDPFFE